MNPPSLYIGLNRSSADIIFNQLGLKLVSNTNGTTISAINIASAITNPSFIIYPLNGAQNRYDGEYYDKTDMFAILTQKPNTAVYVNSVGQIKILDHSIPADLEIAPTLKFVNYGFYLSDTPAFNAPRLDLNKLPFVLGQNSQPYYLKSALTNSLCFIDANNTLQCATPNVDTSKLTNLSITFLVNTPPSYYTEYIQYLNNPNSCCIEMSELCKIGGMTNDKCKVWLENVYCKDTVAVNTGVCRNLLAVPTTEPIPTVANPGQFTYVDSYTIPTITSTGLIISRTAEPLTYSLNSFKQAIGNPPEDITFYNFDSSTNQGLMNPANLYDMANNISTSIQFNGSNMYIIVNETSVRLSSLYSGTTYIPPNFFKMHFVSNDSFMLIHKYLTDLCMIINPMTYLAELVPVPNKPTPACVFYLADKPMNTKKINFKEIYVGPNDKTININGKYLKCLLTDTLVITNTREVLALPPGSDYSDRTNLFVNLTVMYDNTKVNKYYNFINNPDSVFGCCSGAYDGPDEQSMTNKEFCNYGINQDRCDKFMDKSCINPKYIDNDACSCYNVQTDVLPDSLQQYRDILIAEPACWSANCKKKGYKNSKTRNKECSLSTYCDTVNAWEGADDHMLLLQEACAVLKKSEIKQTMVPETKQTSEDNKQTETNEVIQFVKDYPIVWLFLLIVVVALYFALTHKSPETVYPDSNMTDYTMPPTLNMPSA